MKMFGLFFVSVAAAIDVPSVLLSNGAKAGVRMPIIGLGTGVYDGSPDADEIMKNATELWLSLGGRRLDCSNAYPGMNGVGQGIQASGVDRSEIFITSKVAGDSPMGYNESLSEFNLILQQMRTTYIDLLLIHWPGPSQGGDPGWPCFKGRSSFSFCRTESWRALEFLFKQNKVRAIGVSNFEAKHLQDIFSLGGHIPAVNQVEFNGYWNEPDLVKFCQERNITYNCYSPLGCPDFMHGKWDPAVIDHPVVANVAKNYQGKTNAQVLLRWEVQLGLVTNPRSVVAAHMKDNMNIFDFELTSDDMKILSSIPKPAPPQPSKVCPDPHNIP